MTDIEKRRTEMHDATRQIVQQVLILAWDHWRKHGTPIKREDIDLVMQDIVAMDLIRLIDDLRAENEELRKELAQANTPCDDETEAAIDAAAASGIRRTHEGDIQ